MPALSLSTALFLGGPALAIASAVAADMSATPTDTQAVALIKALTIFVGSLTGLIGALIGVYKWRSEHLDKLADTDRKLAEQTAEIAALKHKSSVDIATLKRQSEAEIAALKDQNADQARGMVRLDRTQTRTTEQVVANKVDLALIKDAQVEIDAKVDAKVEEKVDAKVDASVARALSNSGFMPAVTLPPPEEPR